MLMLSKIIQEVIQLLNINDFYVKALADKANRNQVLSARLLRMANSAYFGCSQIASNIE